MTERPPYRYEALTDKQNWTFLYIHARANEKTGSL